MWSYRNPVRILFGNDRFASIASMVAGRPYALVTYPEAAFQALTAQMIATTGQPLLVVSDIA
ncbi:MAG: hypothetical protein WBA92_05030, partial [Pseudorhodobacter sp.]